MPTLQRSELWRRERGVVNIREGMRRLLVVAGCIYWAAAMLIAVSAFNRAWTDFEASIPYVISAPGIRPVSAKTLSGKYIRIPIAREMKWQV